ncbi:hypothetical protein JSY14_07140 [Brachybacterium sp. EF45031]|uniref:glycosyl hydrolase-related protein n=1 Tax=Brachybacterium sillae TaxID=2810536 RepID=UPI00217E4728|nr:glycosyl hydrolase-related protein [Brachybacterium sillae]MCS6711806.1 hypothetical protein [Brachybacterium sillae]
MLVRRLSTSAWSADEGRYRLRYAIRPDAGIDEAIDLGEALNLAARTLPAGAAVEPVAQVLEGAARVQTVKLAEDRSGDLVVRLYEGAGRRERTTVRVPGARRLEVVDLLERPLREGMPLGHRAAAADTEEITLEMRPFMITTLRASF